jgi:hypothetical protein
MFLRRWQWLFGLFWFVVAAVLLFRHTLLPEEMAGRLDRGSPILGTLMAVVLGCWNIARWYLFYSARVRPAWAEQSPLRPAEPVREKIEEYNPEFDFRKPS